MSNFTVYLIGVVLVMVALAYGAYVLGAAPLWIGIAVVVFFGFGLMGAAKKLGTSSKKSS